MKMKWYGVLVWTVSVLSAATVSAELSPATYRAKQRGASEQLSVLIASVDRQAEEVAAVAKVLSVTRTKTGLKPGDSLTIKYRHIPLEGGMLGISPIPVLAPLQISPAFLKKKSSPDVYEPVAGNQSFSDDGILLDVTLKACFKPIYFDYDSYTLNPIAVFKLQQMLECLHFNQEIKLELIGNTDERGSDDYNMALGESMAVSVKDFLVDAGIDAGRLSLISHGEEFPRDSGSNEKAWSRNRRVEIKVIRSLTPEGF